MKKTTLITMAVIGLTMSGCNSLQPDGTLKPTEFGKIGTSIKTYWNKPTTQAKVEQIKEVLFALGVNTVASVASSYGNTGSVNWYTVGAQAGISTLYGQAAALRQIQGTNQVIDPVAIAQVLQTNGTTQAMAQQVALQVAANLNALVSNGLTPNQASESAASQFDAAAAALTGDVAK